MDIPYYIGLLGALLAGAAYLPQIRHLITEHCSAGISRGAFAMWFIASVFITINAISVKSPVFIMLGLIQIVATALIYIYSTKYRGNVCEYHRSHPENS